MNLILVTFKVYFKRGLINTLITFKFFWHFFQVFFFNTVQIHCFFNLFSDL